MDAFRQPKTSYYMFMAQRSPEKSDLIADSGPMIYIAHELTPFFTGRCDCVFQLR